MKALGRAALVGALAIAIVGMGFPLGSLTALASSAPSFVPDTLTLTPDPSDEGQIVTLRGEFTDPDLGEAHTVQVNWGPGSSTTSLALGARSFVITRAYPDERADPWNVVVTLSDSAGNRVVDNTLTHTVNGVKPTPILSLAPTAIMEDESVVVTVSVGDTGLNDVFTVVVDFGDGSTENFPKPPELPTKAKTYITASHTYVTAGTYVLTATVRDDDGLTGTDTETLDVGAVNTAPHTLELAWVPVLEGDLGMLTGTFIDPDSTDTHTVNVLWADGSPETVEVDAGQREFSVTHTFATAGTHRVEATVIDHPFLASVTFYLDAVVLIRNSAPANVALSVEPIVEGGTARVDGTFTDADADDTHTVVIDWGDGTATELGTDATSFSAEHVYANANTYEIVATVKDQDDATGTGRTTLVVTNRTTGDLLEDLARLVRSWQLDEGTENSILTKIDSARGSLENGDDVCGDLNPLANHVSAQAGKKLSLGQAHLFWAAFNELVLELGCTEFDSTLSRAADAIWARPERNNSRML